MVLFAPRALTKVQSVTIITVIVIAAIGGAVAYSQWSLPVKSQETIKIGVCADLDMPTGKALRQGAVLAAEQLNAEGGIIGHNITVVAEDDDSFTGTDIVVASNAMTKLITVDRADYIISGGQFLIQYQDICAEHKKILLSTYGTQDNYTQRVLDNYEKYRYCFRIAPGNDSSAFAGMLDDAVTAGNLTGFTKIALLQQDFGEFSRIVKTTLESSLPEYGLQLVYSASVPPMSTDFASYFAAIEESGAEILFPIIVNDAVGSFVNEWYERQSPFVLWGVMFEAARSDFWTLTEGKCDTISFLGLPAVGGYPLTNKTIPARNTYIERWGGVPTDVAVAAYDALRFILSDAIKRAGTTETEAVIKTLETVDVETTSARHFIFTSSHDVMVASINDPKGDYMLECIFQWQNGTQVPMRPEALMKEAGGTYRYPKWSGPWSNRNP